MSKTQDAIRTLRSPFKYTPLEEKSIAKNPFKQFNSWMTDALKSGALEPNSMTLATIDRKGFPQARVVLLRGLEHRGFSFFTNYKSDKGLEMSHRKVCLNFFWMELARQVRIVGSVKKLPSKESDEYFASRPRESQISAWASNQSEVISSRAVLEKKYAALEQKFKNKKVPRPSYWGGYVVLPKSIEFWQGKQNRMHDRIRFSRQKSGKWKMERLSP